MSFSHATCFLQGGVVARDKGVYAGWRTGSKEKDDEAWVVVVGSLKPKNRLASDASRTQIFRNGSAEHKMERSVTYPRHKFFPQMAGVHGLQSPPGKVVGSLYNSPT